MKSTVALSVHCQGYGEGAELVNSSTDKYKSRAKQSQTSSPQPHPRDGYIIIQRQILDEGLSAYELSFLITCLLIADHKKSKTPGVVKKSTIKLGQLMGASQKTAWRCKQALIARGIIKPLASHTFIIVNYEDYQSLARTSLVPQPKNATEKGQNFSPPDLPLVTQTNQLVSQTNNKSHRLAASPTDYSLVTNQIAELNKQRSNRSKEVGQSPTTDELKILDILRELKGWRYTEPNDLAWLRDFIQEFPDFDLGQLKLARDYYSGRPPPKHKGGWRKRLRNWMLKKMEFNRKEQPGPRGKPFEQYMREQKEES